MKKQDSGYYIIEIDEREIHIASEKYLNGKGSNWVVFMCGEKCGTYPTKRTALEYAKEHMACLRSDLERLYA